MHSAKPAPDSFKASQEMHPELVAKLIELLLAEMPRIGANPQQIMLRSVAFCAA